MKTPPGFHPLASKIALAIAHLRDRITRYLPPNSEQPQGVANSEGAQAKAKRPAVEAGSGDRGKAGRSAYLRGTTLRDFAAAVAKYRDLTNCSVVSWGRTPEYEKRISGNFSSWHIIDLAVDVHYDRQLPETTARDLARACGLALYRRASHDHLQPAELGGA